MQRLPAIAIFNVLLPTSAGGASSFTVPGTAAASSLSPQTYATLSSISLNNTTATPRTVTAWLIPSGGSASASNQVLTAITVPAAGSAPTTPNIVGLQMPAGSTLALIADAAAAVSAHVSIYLTSP